MTKVNCNVCEHEIHLPEETQEGERFTCPNCFAQLALRIVNGKKVARCAVCREGKTECGLDCERRFNEREKRGFFDIKLD
jgi:hypothetical protein